MRLPRSGAASSAHPIPAAAVGEAVGRLLETLGPAPDLAVVTVTPPLAGAFADIVDAVGRLLQPGTLLGAVAGSSDGSRVGLWAAGIGPVVPFAARVEDPATDTVSGLPALSGREGGVLVLARDPATGRLLATRSPIGAAQTGVPLVGASLTGHEGGRWQRSLAIDGRVVDADAVGVVLGPGVEVDVHLRAGTRPVGPPLTVTGASGLLVDGLDGLPAREVLDRVVAACGPEDRAALRQSIHLAVEVPDTEVAAVPDDRVGDVVGMDRATRALAVTLAVVPGEIVRFHAPDPISIDPAFERSSAEHAPGADGALLVSGSRRVAAGDVEAELASIEELVGTTVGSIGGVTPIVSSWGRSHQLPASGVALVTLRGRR